MTPLCIDLFCGLGGWAEGFLAEGYDCVGFDIERHRYPSRAIDAVSIKAAEYPGQLVLQDVLTLHGSQFREAAVIVASPPCQEYSYMAMPWSRAKQIAAALRGLGDFPARYRGSRTVEQLNALFGACFRIQREASEASTCPNCANWHIAAYCQVCGGSRQRHIPLIVENVKGAQPWVGRAAWSFGSYYLWGDVPALMPQAKIGLKYGHGQSKGKVWHDRPGNVAAHREKSAAVKTIGHVNKRDGYSHTRHLTNQRESDAVKQHGSGPVWFDTGIASLPSGSNRRKAASAQIAKIPFALANHIARVFDPRRQEARAC